jgi:hypothetical protein
MPNYCENDLSVYCEDEARVKEVVDFVHTESRHGEKIPFSFHAIIPYPKEFMRLDEAVEAYDKETEEILKFAGDEEETKAVRIRRYRARPKDGFNQGGYQWCCDNWGTKWDALDFREESVCFDEWSITFDTAWAPPKPVILALSKKFPEVRIELRYFERGGAFNGLYRCEGGEVTFDEQGAYYGTRGG